jgi:hypothetical protein
MPRFDVRGDRHPDDEGQDRPEVRQRRTHVSIGQIQREEDDVARLDVGENLSAGEVGVCVEEPVGERQEQGEPQRGGPCRVVGTAAHADNLP